MILYSITRALNELKLLDGRITRAINESQFITVQTGEKLIAGHITVEQYKESAKSSWDQVNALIARRNEIKSKIVASNAVTEVLFPSGKKYTVAEVIERKNSISYDKSLLNTLKYQYTRALNSLENDVRSYEASLEKRIETILNLGKDGKRDGRDVEIQEITKNWSKEHQPKLIDPVGLKVLIEKLTAEIEEFENECDFILSTSNVVTMIEVSE